MKRALYFLFLSLLPLFLSYCGRGGDDVGLSYNSNVEAFTSGRVSRFSSIYLVLSKEIPADKRKLERLPKLISVSPKVEGEFSFENSRTIRFKPSKELERDQDYRVRVDLTEWFETTSKEEEFQFGFSTLPLLLRPDKYTLDVNEKNENAYDIYTVIYTPDREDPALVESLLAFSKEVTSSWQHSPDGKKHELTLSNVPAGTESGWKLGISVAKNKQGLSEDPLYEIPVPGQNDFSLYDISYVTGENRYIDATFSKRLDPNQDMRGLAFIQDNQSELTQVDNNHIRLYPDANSSQDENVNVHLNSRIRSQSGLTLTEDVIRQVDLEEALPNVRFIGKGVIIPKSEELKVPFQAIYLRGVVVRVIKVLERNVGQFLQENNLDDVGNLMRVGRLVARQTIFFDEGDIDLSHWNTFAVDLRRLIEPEPGAIYRVELSFNRTLSAYPGANAEPLSKAQILADDEIKFKEESSRFDNGGYYYYNGDMDWADYKYMERNDPSKDSYYFNKVQGKNVLATNIGLVAMAGQDGRMEVLAHRLDDARPAADVLIEAYNFQHQVIASRKTDSKGRASLEMEAKPYYLMASAEGERSYLRVDDGSSLSFSSFDVAGEVVQEGIKGFIYGERGVWRPGDTLHLSFMLNDRAKRLPSEHPVTMALYNPLGQMYARTTQSKGVLGLYAFDFPTEADVPTGAWTAKCWVGNVVFTKNLRVETVKPNRLKIQLDMPEKRILRGQALNARLHVEWLQGAVAKNLRYDMQGTFIATPTTFDGYSDYVFDDPSRMMNVEESKLITGSLDEKGDAIVNAPIEAGNKAPGFLLGSFVTKVYERSGDFSVDASRVVYSPYARYVGIYSPQKNKNQLDTGKEHIYKVASVDYQGRPAANTELEVKVYKLYWYWWWDSNQEGLANFVSNSYNKPVKEFTLRTGADGLGQFGLSFPSKEWGTYFIAVRDKGSGHSTGVKSYFDWPGYEGRRDQEGSDAAMMLSFKTDKKSYKPGEKMVISFPSTEGSRAIISVENGVRILSLEEVDGKKEMTTVQLEVTEEMRPNAYVHVTLLQPHAVTRNDLPIRLYGVVPIEVVSSKSRLNPVVQVANEIRLESDYTVTVSEKEGREMAYTLAVVDEGLLDLTRFATPDPWSVFNAREALGVNTWDLYNLVVGAYGGRIEQMFSIGGDDALNKGPKAIVNRFEPVVSFVGPFHLKKGKSQKHVLSMPNYNGRVRVMVVAGDGEAYGHVDKSVTVRKPVMLLGTLPRVIGVGEEMVVPATVFATEDGVGDVKVTIRCSGNMTVMGEASKSLRFDKTGDQLAFFRIKVSQMPGQGEVIIEAEGKGEKSTYKTNLEIRSVRQPQVKTTPVTLMAGESKEIPVDLFGLDGTNQLSLEVANVQPVDLDRHLDYLENYPHDCLEQMVSRAFPALYLADWQKADPERMERADNLVKEVISRLRSYQIADGDFAYWPGTTSSHAWGSVYAVHFLVEAEKKGYLIPGNLRNGALNRLAQVARSYQSNSSPFRDSEDLTQAYRLYVLTLSRGADLGAMNRLREAKALNVRVKWFLAAAYALAGRTDVANSMLNAAMPLSKWDYTFDRTFGSDLRNEAIQLIALCALDNQREIQPLVSRISETLASDEWLDTQSVAFALIALSDYVNRYPMDKTMSFEYAFDGKNERVKSDKPLWNAELMSQAKRGSARLTIENKGESTLYARLVVSGQVGQGEELPYANGLSLAVSYVDMDGKPIDITSLAQGDNFVANVTLRNSSSYPVRHVVLSQIFPAGWEILNTRYARPANPGANEVGIQYQDVRDDRVYSHIDLLPSGRQVAIRVNLCAVYPGQFYLPPVSCEAMYDARIRANTKGQQVEVNMRK